MATITEVNTARQFSLLVDEPELRAIRDALEKDGIHDEDSPSLRTYMIIDVLLGD